MKSACRVPFRQASFEAQTPPRSVPTAVPFDHHHSHLPLHLVAIPMGRHVIPPSFRRPVQPCSSRGLQTNHCQAMGANFPFGFPSATGFLAVCRIELPHGRRPAVQQVARFGKGLSAAFRSIVASEGIALSLFDNVNRRRAGCAAGSRGMRCFQSCAPDRLPFQNYSGQITQHTPAPGPASRRSRRASPRPPIFQATSRFPRPHGPVRSWSTRRRADMPPSHPIQNPPSRNRSTSSLRSRGRRAAASSIRR